MSIKGVKIDTDAIRGTEVDIYCTTSGYFYIYLGDVEIANGRDIDDAKRRASTEIAKRKVKVSVKFIRRDGKAGVATGFHASNGSVLTDVGGTKIQWRKNFSSIDVFLGDTPKETLDRYLELQSQSAKIIAEIRKIESKHMVSLAAEVAAAVKAKTAKEETT